MRLAGVLILCTSAVGCYAQPPLTESNSERSDRTVSVCQVLAAPRDFIGEHVRLRTRYRTDNAHFEYLTDQGCGSVLEIGNIDLVPSETVKQFYDASAKKCADKQARLVCNLEADVDVTVKVVTLQSGKAGVDFTRYARIFIR